jgi:predicted transcriptional regulator
MRGTHPVDWVRGHCDEFVSGEWEEDTIKIIDKLTNDFIIEYIKKEAIIEKAELASRPKILKSDSADLAKKVLKGEYNRVLHMIREEERRKIKEDLLKIADEGEFEDLRREVVSYFQ